MTPSPKRCFQSSYEDLPCHSRFWDCGPHIAGCENATDSVWGDVKLAASPAHGSTGQQFQLPSRSRPSPHSRPTLYGVTHPRARSGQQADCHSDFFRAGDLAGLASGNTAARANLIATPQRGRREDTEPMDNIVRIAFIGLAVLLQQTPPFVPRNDRTRWLSLPGAIIR